MTRENTSSSSKLSDNPSSQLLPSLFHQTEVISSLVELLQEQGVEHEVLDHLLLGAQNTLENRDYLENAEQFNDIFARHGWISTESFSIDTTRKALALHKEGHLEEAEEVILDWFNDYRLQLLGVGRCGYFGDHKLRKAQLEEALKLTQEGRYYGAVPLILIVCEGFARDVLRVDLFGKEPDLTAFDTFVGHSSALPTVVKELTKSVSETSEENVDVPERHGIIHGRTLGYATESNCMKTWLLFIALTDLHIERLNRDETANGASIPTELSMKEVVLMLLERGETQARLQR